MSMMNCKKLRLAVGVAALLFVLGFLLQLPRVLFTADHFQSLLTLLSGMGLLAMVLSPLLILGTALLSLLPGGSDRLSNCQH